METMKLLSARWIVPALLIAAGAATGSLITYTLSRPQAAMAASARVFEMRIYTTMDGRLPALEKRFREHTMEIFEKHGMKNVGYWVPQDEPKHSNTLVYVISHENREAAKANWAAFSADPEWKAVSKASEADGGKIVQKVESTFMDSTSYSPIQ